METSNPSPTDDLSPTEAEIWEAAETGDTVDLRMREPEERVVRASVVARLLLDRRGQSQAPLRAVRIQGGMITGPLNLVAATLPCPLDLIHCMFDEPLNLREASAPTLRLTGSHLQGLDATQLTTARDLQLNSGFQAESEVSLRGAHIGGQLDCRGGRFHNDNGAALDANALKADQDVFLSDEFQAFGLVSLFRAQVGGYLTCQKGKFGNANGPALSGLMLDVGGDVLLNDGFSAEGGVHLQGAHVRGRLICSGGKFRDAKGAALDATALKVDQDVYLDDEFDAVGEVNLTGARIGGLLLCSGGRFHATNGAALAASGVEVGGIVALNRDFQADGEVRLDRSRIKDSLICGEAQFRNATGAALHATALKVDKDVLINKGFDAVGEVSLVGAHVGGVLSSQGSFHRSDGTALDASWLQVDQEMLLGDKFMAEGQVMLRGARVGGQLVIQSKFNNANGHAISASRLRVNLDLSLDGVDADGEVDVSGAQVGGRLACSRSMLRKPNGTALRADGLQVDQDMLLGSGFVAEGQVTLAGARVGGGLHCVGSKLQNGNLHNGNGVALDAGRLQVDQDILFGDEFQAEGELNLHDAHVGGLKCTGSRLLNPNDTAFAASGLQVDQDMLLGPEFEVDGEFNVRGGHVGGQLRCIGSKFHNPGGAALDLERVELHRFLLRSSALDGVLNLTDARIDHYKDDRQSWPQHRSAPGVCVGACPILLVGLTYQTISADPPISWRERLEWLRLDTGGYSPQPYDQLAAAYRFIGEEDDAIRVAIAKRRRRRRQLNPLSRALDGLLDVLVGYGYRTWKAFGWLAGLLAVGTTSLSIAHAHGLVEAAKKPPGQQDFDAFRYAVDWIVPILNLHQREVWKTHGVAQWLTLGFATAGWILTTAVVLGLSGVLKRD